MRTKSVFIKCLVLIVIIIFLQTCECRVTKKFKRKIDSESGVRSNIFLKKENRNITEKENGRGFGSLLSLGKVLNFFPVGGERECRPEGYHAARAGICLNPYDCRQRDGKAAGDCAHGLGVCCIFEVTCGAVVQNNLTYFMSPGFPELWSGDRDCNITIEKSYAGIMQLRIDFVHFTIGQPNRRTGECDEDAMILGEGRNNFTLCGQNHGQHIYYTLSSGETREAGELPSAKSTRLAIVMRGPEMPRLWLMRLAQMPLAQSAPHDCLQYFTENNGTIKSFNFAINGRHLASQEYRACVRKNAKYCAVRYGPCDNRSFRIGPRGDRPQVIDPLETMQEPEMMPVNDLTPQQDEEEGSGADPETGPAMDREPPPRKGIMATIWNYIWPSWLWGQGGARTRGWGGTHSWGHDRTYNFRWSPYAQHYGNQKQDDRYRYYGYGNFGLGLYGFGRQRCQDRVTIPCENEYFVSSTSYNSGVCDPHHCGNTFCPGVPFSQCHVETSTTPFAVSFHFGPPTVKRSPEENIGACIRYTQLPCDS